MQEKGMHTYFLLAHDAMVTQIQSCLYRGYIEHIVELKMGRSAALSRIPNTQSK